MTLKTTAPPFRPLGTATLIFALCAAASARAQHIDWPTPSGDPGAMRYAALADINRTNVGRLKLAWR